MTTITFDTRKAVRNLQDAGFSDAQADAMVDTLSAAFTETVATKTDIAEVKTDIAEVKAELKSMATKADIADLKADMLKVAMGVAIAIILANATMTIALIRFLG